jgi:replicative DNA helicase Mcm
MDAAEQIELFYEFIDTHLKAELLKAARKEECLKIDFSDLSKFNPGLADLLLENPEDVIKAAELSVQKFDISKQINVRVYNLPLSARILIRNIRSKHIDQFLHVVGVVRQKSDVRPQVTEATFECPACGNILKILQLDSRFRTPSKCSCGRKGKFLLQSKELIDAQKIVMEEASEDLEGGEQPKRINVILKKDLVSPFNEKKTNPGTKVNVVGILKEIPITLRSGEQSTRYELMIEANYIDRVEEDFGDISIERQEIKQITELAKDPNIFEKLRNSIAPSIYGHERVKDALVLQLFGGVRKVRDDGVITRGDTHTLLIGDPGAAKSQMLKRMSVVAPKSRYVSGKGVSLEYNEPLLIKENKEIKIAKIGEFVDRFSDNQSNVFVPLNNEIETLSLNPITKKVEWKKISHVFRHKSTERLLRFNLESGREITVTKDHSIYTLENGKAVVKKSQDLRTNDYVLIPNKIPVEEKDSIDEDYARLLGYFIAEGHLHSEESKDYKVEFTLGKKDISIINDLIDISKRKFNKEVKIRKHGKNAFRLTINGKEAYNKVVDLLGSCAHRKAKEKKIPEIIFNSNEEIRKQFIKACIMGDAGVTKSKNLASDLLYLFLQNNQIASCTKKYTDREVKINGREIHCLGNVYELKSPKGNRKFDNRYARPPFAKFGKTLSKYFFKKMRAGKYCRVSFNSISNNMLWDRFCHLAQKIECKGKELKTLFGNSILEYMGEHDSLFQKHGAGREVLVTITQEGNQLIDEMIDFVCTLNSDFGFARIKKIEEVKNSHDFVYDVSVPFNENFVGGFGGIICHNSGAGLTATVVKDEFTGGWSLEAGAIVLANKGYLMIDEMDKMGKDDRDAMHEAMEQQSVSISKANIQATLRAETSVLSAANPKFGRFDPYMSIFEQIDLPPTLINRFDLIFPIKDYPDKKKDKEMSRFILRLHQNKKEDKIVPDIETKLLRKYVAYSRQNVFPKLTDDAVQEIQKYYIKMRSSGTETEGIKSVPISARQLEAVIRLAEASAKVRLSDEVGIEDARRAIDLIQFCLSEIAIDRETGKIDIDKISSGITASERGKIVSVREIINELENKIGRVIPIDDIIKEAEERGISSEKVEDSIEKLKRSGDIFEPKRGFISKL